jgi:uridylate kinase
MSKTGGSQVAAKPIYPRVLLKISGEGLAGPNGYGIGAAPLRHVANELKTVHEMGVEVAVVVGGGNILRGESFARETGVAEATAHYMGMMATVLNALALQETLEAMGLQTRVLSAIEIASVCEPYIRRRCMHHLEKGRITILAAGTGRPFVTTDTAAALNAVEIRAGALLKATQVEGVYSADPKKDPHAEFFQEVSYDRVITERLKVMDVAAVDLCQRNNVTIHVFSLHEAGNMRRLLLGEPIGTVISK